TSGVLKNAIDYVYAERNNKAMGVVSYGATGGTRAAEHLRLIARRATAGRRAHQRRALAVHRLHGLHRTDTGRPPEPGARHPARPGHRLEPGARPAAPTELRSAHRAVHRPVRPGHRRRHRAQQRGSSAPNIVLGFAIVVALAIVAAGWPLLAHPRT